MKPASDRKLLAMPSLVLFILLLQTAPIAGEGISSVTCAGFPAGSIVSNLDGAQFVRSDNLSIVFHSTSPLGPPYYFAGETVYLTSSQGTTAQPAMHTFVAAFDKNGQSSPITVHRVITTGSTAGCITDLTLTISFLNANSFNGSVSGTSGTCGLSSNYTESFTYTRIPTIPGL